VRHENWSGGAEGQDRFNFAVSSLRRSETEYQNLGVTRLPTMEVNTEPAGFFAPHLVIRID